MIPVRINSKTYKVPSGSTILEACKHVGIYVPSICSHTDLPPLGVCGLCVVKVDGQAFCYSCMTNIKPNMVVETDSEDVLSKTKMALDKFMDMSKPPNSPEIEELFNYIYQRKPMRLRNPERTNALIYDPETCLNCHRCISLCGDVLQIDALSDAGLSIKNSNCISCGLCTTVCPTGSLKVVNSTPSVLRALASGRPMILIVDPSVNFTCGEAMGDQIGTVSTGKIISAAKEVGFKMVFNAGFATDLSIIKHAEELEKRITNKSNQPLFTSNCPSFVNFIEKQSNEAMHLITPLRSPHLIVARHIKNTHRFRSQKVFIAYLTGCVGAKEESKRMQLGNDLDAVLTVREFVELVKSFGIEWITLKNGTFDEPYNESSSSAMLAGVSGGFAEGVLRTLQTKNSVDVKVMNQIRNIYDITSGGSITGRNSGIASGEFDVGNNTKVKVAVCNGIAAVRELIDSGEYKEYDFIEANACPGGCVRGGGQPLIKSTAIALDRQSSVYKYDEKFFSRSSPLSNQKLLSIWKSVSDSAFEKKHLYTHLEPQQSATLIVRKKHQYLPIVAFAGQSTVVSGYARLAANLMKCQSAPMNNIDGTYQLLKRKQAIFIVETMEDGKFPRNGMKFIQMLQASTDDLTEVQYSVFAVGKRSEDNENYAAAGEMLDTLLSKRNAKAILPLTKSDTGLDDFGLSSYIEWSNELSKVLFLKKPLVGVELVNKLVEVEDKSILEKPARPIGFEMATMVERELLSPEGQIPAMHRYLIKLPEGMSYEVGDHVTVLARNDPDIVDRVIEALGYQRDLVFSLENGEKQDSLIPQKISVHQLFTQYLDLNGLPTRALLRSFADCANEEGKKRLEPLLDESDTTAFNQYLEDINVAEFIEDFAKYGSPPITQMVSAMPKIAPRIYSIASAPDLNRGYLELVVLDVHFGKDLKRYGITTHFLARPDLSQLAIHCMRGIFSYPAEVDTPIIMIALGGGISPMFSLIQYRIACKEKLGPAYLFFGSKYRGAYPLLNKKLDNFYATGIVQELFVAYSRDGPKRVHIQDLLKQQSEKLWELWQDPKTQLFYCGPARSVPEEIKEIFLNLTIREGYLSIEEAMAYNSRHEFHIEGYSP